MKNHQTSNTPPADKCARRLNKRGSILISAVLAAILLTMVSVGYFATLTGSFGAVKSSGDALEAQRVAEIESNKIKLTDYENLDSKVQQGKWVDAPDNPGWQYFVTLGSEKVIDGDNKQRIAEVKVRRKGDEESRFSTAVPVSSEESGGGVWGKRDPVIWHVNSHIPAHREYFYEGIEMRSLATAQAPYDGFFVFNHPRKATSHDSGGEHGSKWRDYGSILYINGESYPTGYGEPVIAPVKKGEIVSYTEYGPSENTYRISLKPVEYYNKSYPPKAAPAMSGVIDNCYFIKVK
mgnify:CR=1 FL=1